MYKKMIEIRCFKKRGVLGVNISRFSRSLLPFHFQIQSIHNTYIGRNTRHIQTNLEGKWMISNLIIDLGYFASIPVSLSFFRRMRLALPPSSSSSVFGSPSSRILLGRAHLFNTLLTKDQLDKVSRLSAEVHVWPKPRGEILGEIFNVGQSSISSK